MLGMSAAKSRRLFSLMFRGAHLSSTTKGGTATFPIEFADLSPEPAPMRFMPNRTASWKPPDSNARVAAGKPRSSKRQTLRYRTAVEVDSSRVADDGQNLMVRLWARWRFIVNNAFRRRNVAVR